MLLEDFEAERVGAGEIALGAGKLFRAWPFLGKAPELALDDLKRLPHPFILRRHIANEHGAILVGEKVRVHRIGKSALLAHLLHQARGEAAAADDVIEDIGGDEVVVLAREGAMAELRHGLGHFHHDDLAGRAHGRLGVGDRSERGGLRQCAEHVV